MLSYSNMSEYFKRSNISVDTSLVKLDEIGFNLNISSMSLGVINNMMSIFILCNKRLRKRKFNWYLLVLSIFEFIFCFTVFFDYIFIKIYKEQLFLHDLNEISFMVTDYIVHTTDSCTIVLTVLLAIDRLYAIKKPMKIKVFVTNLHAKKLMAFSLFLLLSLKTSSFIFCQFNIENSAHIIYCSLVSNILFNFAPLSFVLVLNIVLAKEMYNYYKRKTNIDFNKTDSFSRSQLDISSQCQTKLSGSIRRKSRFTRSYGDLHVKTRNFELEPNTSINLNPKYTTPRRITLFTKSHGDLTANYSRASQNLHLQLNASCEIMRKFCVNSKSQKSHYIVILVSSLWSLLTTIPYYTFITYDSLFKLNFFSNIFDLKTTAIIQIISSILFNFNHVINFFIYLCFNEEFRNVLFKCLTKKSSNRAQPISANSSFRKK